LADDAFVTRNSNGESRHNWSSIVTVEPEMERLFVFVTDRCAFIVAKRAFNDETRFDSFSAEASARWKAARA
jgi:YcxB-like protein